MLSPAAVRRDLLRAAGQAGTLLGRGRRVAAPMVDQALERLNERSLLGFSLDGQAVSVHGLVARVVRERGWPGRDACGGVPGRPPPPWKPPPRPSRSRADHAARHETLGQVTALLENARAPAADAAGDWPGRDPASTPGAASPDRAGRRPAGHRHRRAAGRGARASARLRSSGHHPRAARPGRAPTGRQAGSPRRSRCSSGLSRPRSSCSGPGHPSTLASRNNLGSAYRATGRPAEAIPLFEQNVAACEELLGADHPKTLASRHSLDLARQESAATAPHAQRR